MSTLSPPRPASPPHTLHRAENLNVRLANVVEDALDNQPRRHKLSASIRRKFKEMKEDLVGRSRSLPTTTSHSVTSEHSDDSPPPKRNRHHHARAHSDAQIIRQSSSSHQRSGSMSTLPTLATQTPLTSVPEVMSPLEATESDTAGNAKDATFIGDVSVSPLLRNGTPMTKISNKRQKKVILLRLDPDRGQIVWESKKHKIIPIEAIKEIRSGKDARYQREQFQISQQYEDRWLSIVYILDGDYKTLHLIAATKDVFSIWESTLRKLHAIRQELMTGLGNVEMRQAIWEKHYWKSGDHTDTEHKLSFEEVEKLCKRLNINTNTEDLRRLFSQADSHNRGYLDFEGFRRFVKLLKARPEITRLYKKLCATNGGNFDFSVFEDFMKNKQKSKASDEDLRRLFDKYAVDPAEESVSTVAPRTSARSDSSSATSPTLRPYRPPGMKIITRDSFMVFLLSKDNAVFSRRDGDIWQDMTHPLSEYYISSSHNTYLVGHQLVGDSTVEGYIRALLHSCRSVELDIYDGDNEPMIFHGKTFTSKVSLREVCQAILKYGFVASPYPIIISAEIHCGLVQQDMIAEIMIAVFGDALVRAPMEGRQEIKVLPSPEELKGRILLKTKNLLISRTDSVDGELSHEVSTSSTSDSEPLQEVFIPSDSSNMHRHGSYKEPKENGLKVRSVLQRVRSVGKSSSSSLTRTPSIGGAIKSPGILRRGSIDQSKPKMSMALVSLLVYTVGVKCRGINKKEQYAIEHMFSLSENMANKMLKSGMMDLIKHNLTHLTRIYPKGLRLNSTNFEPHRYWSAGSQLVAINWQTFDIGYMINHAMFQRNGRSGYVLKPIALRTSPKERLSQRTKHELEVNIISAQQLPRAKDSSGREVMDKSSVDPYVEVTIHVPDWTYHSQDLNAEAGGASHIPPSSVAGITPAHTISYRTGMVKNNGFNPVWEEKLHIPFECVGDMMDLIFVRFSIRQADKDLEEPLGVYCVSLGSLEQGYRHLPLHDTQLSQYLFSTLFVRIGIKDL